MIGTGGGRGGGGGGGCDGGGGGRVEAGGHGAIGAGIGLQVGGRWERGEGEGGREKTMF